MTGNENFFNQETGRFARKCANRTTSKRVIGPSIDNHMAKNLKHLCDSSGDTKSQANESAIADFLVARFFLVENACL